MRSRRRTEAGEGVPGRQSESQLADAPAQTAGSATTLSAGEASTEEVRGDALANQVASRSGSAPGDGAADRRSQARTRRPQAGKHSTGDLLTRLETRAVSPDDRLIAALVTLRLADRAADAAVIVGAPTETLALDENLKRRQSHSLRRLRRQRRTTSSCSDPRDSRPDCGIEHAMKNEGLAPKPRSTRATPRRRPSARRRATRSWRPRRSRRACSSSIPARARANRRPPSAWSCAASAMASRSASCSSSRAAGRPASARCWSGFRDLVTINTMGEGFTWETQDRAARHRRRPRRLGARPRR